MRNKNRRLAFVVLSMLVAALASCGPEVNEQPAILAKANIYAVTSVSDDSYTVSTQEIGAATFSERNGIVTIKINAIDLTPSNRHAIHIHEGTCESPDAHWNQNTQASFCTALNLGAAWAKPYAGDVGNIRADATGTGYFELSTEFWRLGTGDDFDITGKVLIIHANEEDFAQECFQDHNHAHNNAKIACGTIELITND